MKKRDSKKAERILTKWRKTMPFYYGVVWIILIAIVLIKSN